MEPDLPVAARPDRRGSEGGKAALALYLAVFWVLILLPFDFHAPRGFGSGTAPEESEEEARSFGAELRESLGHAVLFLPLAPLIRLAFGPAVSLLGPRVLVPVVALAGGSELAQLTVNRGVSLPDFLMNIAGYAGSVLAVALHARSEGVRRVARALSSPLAAGLGAVLLLVAGLLLTRPTGRLPFGPGDLESWDPSYPLVLANEPTASRPWRGSLRRCAVYAAAVDPLPAPLIEHRFEPGDLLISESGRVTGARASAGPALTCGERPGPWPLPGGGLEIREPTVLASARSPAAELERLRRSDGFAVEVVFTPADLAQGGPARIVSSSVNNRRRNFTLGQEKDGLEFRVRTAMTGLNGSRVALQVPHCLAAGRPVRALASYEQGTLELHLDGRPAGRLRLNLLTWVSWEIFGAPPAGRVAAGLLFTAWAGFLALLALAFRRFFATRLRLAVVAAAAAAAVLVLALAGTASAAEPAGTSSWPCWRGPAGDGISPERGLPERFGRAEGVVWSREDPGLGHSSPIVWKDSLFFTTCAGDSRLLIRLRIQDGSEVWRREVLKSPRERMHQKNSAASSTPATDGERVYTAFLDGERVAAVAYDFAGKETWRVSPGEFHSMHGFSSTPVLFADLVLLNCDQDADAYLVAFDRRTGDTRWRVDREEKIRSYCPPSIFTVEGRPQMVLSGARKISAYEPATGKPLWWCDGPTEQTVATLAHGSGLVFVTGGYPDREILAIDPRGRGDVTASHVRWRSKQGVSYVPSPIYRDGHFYVVSDTGVLSAIAAVTGNYVKQKRLRGNFSASLFIAGERLYALSEEGDVFVLRASPELETLAEIAMEEPIYATPAVAAGRMYLRTWKRIYAIGKAPAPPSASGDS